MNRDLRLVSASLLLWGVGEGMFAYFQAIYLEALGASPLQIGIIFGFAGAGLALTHIPAGAISDTVGRKSMMVVSWVVATLACWVMFAASSLALFSVALVAYFMTSFVMAPLSSYITTARDQWPASRALTTVFAAFNAGAVVGPILGGTLAAVLGLRSVFGFAGVIFIGSTALILAVHSQGREPAHHTQRYRGLLRNQALARFVGLSFLALFATYLSWPLTPNYLRNVQAVSLSTLGVFGAFNGLGAVALNLSLGRRNPILGFILSQAFVGLSALLFWKGAAAPLFAAAYFLSAGFRALHSMVTARVDALVGRAELGLAFGLVETVLALVILSAPPLAGALYEISPRLPYPVSIALIAVSVVLSVRYACRARPVAAPVELPVVERLPGGD